MGGDLFGGALGGDLAAFGSGFGADVEDVVGFGWRCNRAFSRRGGWRKVPGRAVGPWLRGREKYDGYSIIALLCLFDATQPEKLFVSCQQ